MLIAFLTEKQIQQKLSSLSVSCNNSLTTVGNLLHRTNKRNNFPTNFTQRNTCMQYSY